MGVLKPGRITIFVLEIKLFFNYEKLKALKAHNISEEIRKDLLNAIKVLLK